MIQRNGIDTNLSWRETNRLVEKEDNYIAGKWLNQSPTLIISFHD